MVYLISVNGFLKKSNTAFLAYSKGFNAGGEGGAEPFYCL